MKTLKYFKQTFVIVLLFSMMTISSACSNIDEGYNRIPSNFYPAQVNESTGVKLVGIGVELDPHFFSQNLTRPEDGSKAEDWNIVKERVKKMGVQNFRVMVQPHWWEPLNDNDDPNVADMSKFTFDSQEMQSLYKVLELIQENNGEVTLVLWGCPVNMDLIAGTPTGKHFLCDSRPNAPWVCGTDKYQEFAENFSVLVKYLIETKGFTCVKAITPFNEPDSHTANYGRTMWQGEPDSHPDQYAPMVKALDAKFKAMGLRDKVEFNLSDNTDGSPDYLKSCAEDLQAETNLLNTHTYKFGYTTSNADIVNWEKNNVTLSSGKEHFVGEFGSNETSGSSRQLDIDKYERGILLTRITINLLNGGAVGVSYWSLIDQYYSRNGSYSEMQQLGLWKYVKKAYEPDPEIYNAIQEDYEVRPHYYAYSMLTRFIKKNAEVFPLDLNENLVAGTAILNENNKWVYIFANGSEHNKPVEIINDKAQANGEYEVYKYVEGNLPTGDNLIQSTETINIKDKTSLSILRSSVLILVQK